MLHNQWLVQGNSDYFIKVVMNFITIITALFISEYSLEASVQQSLWKLLGSSSLGRFRQYLIDISALSKKIHLCVLLHMGVCC